MRGTSVQSTSTFPDDRRPVRFGRSLRFAVVAAIALVVVLNWESALSVLFGLAVGGLVLLTVGLLLVRLVMSWTGIGTKPILAGIVGFVLGRMSRR